MFQLCNVLERDNNFFNISTTSAQARVDGVARKDLKKRDENRAVWKQLYNLKMAYRSL